MRAQHFAGAVAVGAALLTWSPAALAEDQQPSWTCRASAVVVASPGQGAFEPTVANDTATGGCADSDAGSPTLEQAGSASLQGPFAHTQIDPDLVPSLLQRVESRAGVANATIQNTDGSFRLTVTSAVANVSATCDGTTARFASSGTAGTVTVNGLPVSTDSPLSELGDGLNGSPLGGTIRVSFNEVTSEGSSDSPQQALVRRAVHVQILAPGGATLFDTVVGQAQAGRLGAVCQPGVPPGGCAAGSVEHNGVCVVTITSGGGTIVVLGAGPQGGFLASPSAVPLGLRRECARTRLRFNDAIIGTNRADRITGTNQSDLILSLGGDDVVSGGRGKDCIQGGTGSDNLDGSDGNDWVFGDSGKDVLNGGAGRDHLFGRVGNDRLSGGSGNDTLNGGAGRDRQSGGLGNDLLIGGPGRDFINTGNGRDRVHAGPGNDVINAATAGPPARVNCGDGHDVVRVNGNETRRTRGCETMLVLHKRQ